MMSTSPSGPFINPYQFIDISEPVETCREQLLGTYPAVRDLKSSCTQIGHLTHDRWLTNSYSGYFLCGLETKSQVVVGGRQTAATREAYGQVEPFKYNGRIALPASSLRGMLSAIVEIASGSAPRILDRGGILSYRVDLSDALSAMAIVEADPNDPAELVLRPLALPTFEIHVDQRGKWSILNLEHFLKKWARSFPKLSLKSYFDMNQIQYEDSSFISETTGRQKYTRPLAVEMPDLEVDYQIIRKGNDWRLNIQGQTIPLKVKAKDGRHFVLGGYAGGPPEPYDDADPPRDPHQLGYVRGIEANGDKIHGRKYDVFLDILHSDTPILPLPEAVVRRYVHLAAEAYAYALAERQRSGRDTPSVLYPRNAPKGADGNFRPKPGDILFFDMSQDGESVTEISYSAAWRKYALKNTSDRSFVPADVHDFFEASEARAGRRLRPVTPETANEPLSRAEALFGFVAETNADDQVDDRAGLAYAGRIQVGFATLAKGQDPMKVLGRKVALRVLASPKLPSESFYFHGAETETPEVALSLNSHRPNGHKMYVHRQGRHVAFSKRQNPVRDDQVRQKMEAEPIREYTKFTFRVYFENLDLRELQLLAFSLKPFTTFHHKIGLGRGIGLGTVRIWPQSLVLWDRQQRYLDPFDMGYETRLAAGDDHDLAPDKLASAWRVLLQAALPETARALEAIGKVPDKDKGSDNDKDTPPVAHPYARDQDIHTEDRTFSWSANNKRLAPKNRQALGPIRNGKLARLTPNGKDKDKDKGGRQ